MAVILLIEDDRYLQRDLRILLLREGYAVLQAEGIASAKQTILSSSDISLILLDLWLPDGNGLELLPWIREKTRVPLLILSAADDESSVIRGLEEGADDYITKPFRKAELLSRIRANLRRLEYRQEQTILRAGDLMLNPFTHDVTIQEKPVPLTAVEFRLLENFMENPGILLSRERLITMSAQDFLEEDLEENTLNVRISRLRAKIGPGMIETVRGFGYRFNGEVRRIYGGL